ncbi:hypothetical protein [Paramaledivibacter caminithermalis]|jgi:septal ring factor EnvC (AmiA/AmiB activator)|uniref:Uncharacterized protein n=1 Tax=Paramaledivibacter caminithermalis (strain DSM 15212 / CIP 107654 / DViRD3) TaxID=1121301 RepID=A0A1M6NVE7_PARC5|nr:hypothetical protein [Paramaledivibacter caminithermalis]SHJ99584.1 hypothetical protein SAMN02745912_01897 [Paramaledivibacter caminithermalis DSM 15212]
MSSELLYQILNELKTIKSDISDLKTGQSKLEKGMTNLEKGQAKLEKSVANLEKGQQEIKKEISFMWEDIKRLDNRLTKQEQQTYLLKRLK